MESRKSQVGTSLGMDSLPSLRRSDSVTVEISFLDIRIKATMPPELLNDFKKASDLLLPRSIRMQKPKTLIEISASYGESKLVAREGYASIVSNAEPKQFAIDLAFAGSKLLELELNKRGMYSLHASAISYKGKSIVFIGPPGAGKTTTALSCALSDREVGLISDDRVVIDGNSIVGSTRSLNVRNGSISSELDRFRVTPSKLKDAAANKLGDSRAGIEPHQLGLTVSHTFPMSLDTIIHVKKIPVKFSATIEGVAKTHHFLRLYEALSFYNDEAPAIVLANKLPYPELFDMELKNRRIEFAGELLETKRVMYAEGELADIVKYILSGAYLSVA